MTFGWNFPPKPDGGFDGFKDSGIETFLGSPFQSLAREVLQNSLDAKASNVDNPVSVIFEIVAIERDQFPAVEEFKKVLKKCLEECSKEDKKERDFFKNALAALDKKRIPCLRIEDHNTTGLRGKPDDRKSQWYAMTKATGRTVKNSEGAGGSFGIGKNAPFAVSALRTVFYYTCYRQNGRDIERMQGKSILMSHCGDTDIAQGVGYYGIRKGCLPVDSPNIPPFMQRNAGKNLSSQHGTTLVIPGFTLGDNWENIIASAVLSNFFCAVHDGELQVMISPENDEKMMCIEQSNLGQMFERMLSADGLPGEDKEQLEYAKHYLSAITCGEKKSSEQALLGHCDLMLNVDQGLPQKIAIIRKTGMLITDEMPRLKQFRQCRDFAGVLVCRAAKGNALMRDMENPQHNAFEPSRMASGDIQNGKKALSDLAEWVRCWVKTIAGAPSIGDSVELDELKEYIPDEDSDDLSGERGESRESNIEGAFVFTPKRPRESEKIIDRDDGGDSGGQDPDNEGQRSGNGGGAREGGRGGYSGRKPIPIKNLRILPLAARKKRVLFTPEKAGEIRFSLEIAGDSVLESLQIVGIETSDGRVAQKINSSTFRLSVDSGERVNLVATLGEDIPHALVLRVYENDQRKND